MKLQISFLIAIFAFAKGQMEGKEINQERRFLADLFYSHALYYTVSNKHRTTRYRDWYVYRQYPDWTGGSQVF